MYEALKSVSAKYEHASRWYTHIKSYQSEKNKLPGLKKSLQDYGVSAGGGKPAAKDDDDDIDLFGSDEEPDEEAEKAREERLKAYAEKKAKSMGVIRYFFFAL